MREKDSPEVIAHLEAENAWTAAQTAHLEGLQESIFTEIKTRIKETDMSVPNRRGAYWYFSRTRAGLDYGISVRVPISGPEDWTPPTVGEDELPGEEVVFDSNLAAEGQEFFSLGSFSLSDDGRWLLYGVDTTETNCIPCDCGIWRPVTNSMTSSKAPSQEPRSIPAAASSSTPRSTTPGGRRRCGAIASAPQRGQTPASSKNPMNATSSAPGSPVRAR